jgi:hypothetical protein
MSIFHAAVISICFVTFSFGLYGVYCLIRDSIHFLRDRRID